jgi:hypothetical protein
MFGFGSRNPQMRSMRIALLVVLLVAGAAFHDKGTTYTIIRVAYYAVILGGLGFVLWRRQGAKRQAAADGAPGGPEVDGAPSPGGPVRQPGWFPDQQDMTVQRYWDGSAWTRTRRWDNDQWVDT